ncbi:Putative mutator protein MutT4 [Corynebacterium diphtheriae subsp. lausannense]|uniref:NUDIX hydrolase n=1 Tax=Corynebacterium belfantii TaxID=2014537 RepID=UPI000DC1D67B|nr:NUDIX hydrolase [Corynebacterium belfantii]QVI99367.1 NUDIX hydrolase [Corynebacterium diphtheriae]SPJ42365.1 Putative mutator protein MutT4 [Corynebacterium diphtheriae subsp. lausannense]
MTENERAHADHASASPQRTRRRRGKPRRRMDSGASTQGGDASKSAAPSSSTSGSRGERGSRGEDKDKQNKHTRRKRRPAHRSTQRGSHSGDSSHSGSGTKRRRHAGNRNRGNQSRRQNNRSSRIATRDETSAGGLVISGLAEAVDENNNVDLSRIYVALIGRLDRRGRLLWSMPKGHVEPGEETAATAEREVWEETGIHGEVITQLGTIDYWFVSEGVRIHKTVHHHLLRYVDGYLNDEDPEVTEVAWIPADELIEHFAYADERKLARIAHDVLPEYAIKEKAAGRVTPR